MATQADFLARVRTALDEPSAVNWTNAELYGYINEAAADIARRSETIQKTHDLNATAGTRKYTLPADTLRVHKVDWQATGDQRIYPLDLLDLHNMDAMWYTQQAVTQQTPSAVTFWGYPPSLQMISYPTPPTAGKFIIYYYGTPDPLKTDGTDATKTVIVPGGWEDLVVEYAVYLAFRRDANQRWQEHKAAYEEHVDQLLTHTYRWTDQQGTIVPNSGGRILPNWLTGF